MAHLKKQNKEAKPMEKLKKHLDRIRLKYTEKTSGKSTMIRVRSMQLRDRRNEDFDKKEDSER